MFKNSKVLVAVFLTTGAMIYLSTSHANLSESIRDEGVKNNLQIRMLLKSGVPNSDIEVHVNDKIIQIAGFVDNRKEYRNVSDLTTKYKNEYRVINNVKILTEKDSAADERALRENVQKQLSEHKYPVDDIDVQVRNGHVILSGFVNKHIPLKEIKGLSQSVPGVTTVDNYLLYRQA